MNQRVRTLSDMSDSNPLSKLSKKPVYELEVNYFQQFPNDLLDVIRLSNSTDPDLTSSPPADFSVPDAYFNTLPDQIMHKIKAMETIVTDGQYMWESNRKPAYKVPEAYFDQLPETILAQVHEANNKDIELSATLSSLKNKTVFQVPDSYLKEAVTVSKPKMTVHKAQRSIKWSGWAAAAAVIFLFVLGGIKFLPGSDPNSKYNAAQQLALIS